MPLKGKTALVTGAAVRVGREIALALAQAGAEVAVHCNASREPAERTAADCRALGVRAQMLSADLSDPAAARALPARVFEKFGRLDIVVNNAAVFSKTPLETLADADWDGHIAVNLRAPYEIALAAAPLMRKSGGGRIVNIADRVAFGAYKDYLPYIVAKAGVVGLTRALALELAPHICVNAVAPGAVLLPEDFAAAERAAIAAEIPAGRTGKPQDVAATVRFLCEGPDFITGQVIVVDGGRSVKM